MGGEYGIILPFGSDQIAVLDAWATWKLTAITAEQEAHLNAIEEGWR